MNRLKSIRKCVSRRLRGHINTFHAMCALGIPAKQSVFLAFGPHTWNSRTIELNEGALNKLQENNHV